MTCVRLLIIVCLICVNIGKTMGQDQLDEGGESIDPIEVK